MKALVWHAKKNLSLDDIPAPIAPAEGEVILKVDWCGICGTDIEEYTSGPMYIPVDTPNPLTGAIAPLVLGHEMVGTIVEVGKNVTHVKVGDRVTPDPIIFCHDCHHCNTQNPHHCENMAHLGLTTHGGCAEYVKTRAEVCFKLPGGIDPQVGALSEPASVCVRAVRKAQIQPGESVAVIGAGTIGLITLQLAKIARAHPIIVMEPLESRRRLALSLGADVVIDPGSEDPAEIIRQHTGGLGAHRVIECGGSEKSLQMATKLVRKRGRVILTGLHNAPVSLALFPVVWNEIEIMGSFSHIYNVDFKEAVEHIGENRLVVEPLITGRVNLENAVAGGFEELIHRGGDHVKMLISPHLV